MSSNRRMRRLPGWCMHHPAGARMRAPEQQDERLA
jgi:hypothetical protein